jgi:mannan endo-1,4-beta-mannosidase
MFTLSLTLISSHTQARCDVSLVDQFARNDVCTIVKWFINLPQRSGTNSIMSGQYGWKDAKRIHDITGKWPALYENYLWQKGRSTWDIWPDSVEHRVSMKAYWDAGGLVSLHMPIPNPKNKSHQHDRDMTDHEFLEVTQAGTVLNSNYLEWVGKLADNLAWLQENGVVVIIRPLHEMNHGGFWYGKRDPEIYKKLFQLTIDFLIKSRELHNLIIIYSPNRGKQVLDYYPGHEYVDIVGIDTYYDPPLSKTNEFSQLMSLGKPFALTEVGWSADEKIDSFTRDSSNDIIISIKSTTPSAIWWSSWSRSNSPSSQNNIKILFDDPAVITRDEINWRNEANCTAKDAFNLN